jgi:hypothetical protein
MENQHSWVNPARAAATSASRQIPTMSFARSFSSFVFFVIAIATILVGCGAPGDPVAPSPPVPIAITDLSAHQMGDAVALNFSLPSKPIHGDRLLQPPAIEILRGETKPDGSPNLKSLHVVETIPGELAAKYQSDDRTQIITPISPSENRSATGFDAVFAVRTRASRKRASTDSNAIKIHIYPVPGPIGEIKSQLVEGAINLTWPPVTQTAAGDPITVTEYHVYRGELDPKSYDPKITGPDVLHERFAAPLTLLGRSNDPRYTDKQFDFGKVYLYIVRSVTTAGKDGLALESGDSDALILKPADTFPPSIPQGVVAAAVENPETTPPSQEVDVSWSINTEQDLAGYRVYRSEREGDKGAFVTQDLLLSPAYRDTSVASGHQYWYSVTAVDLSGNESAPSPQVAADVAQHSP